MVATCGDDTGLTAREWTALMCEKGLTADAQFSVQMPNTYVLLPGFDVDSPTLEAEKFGAMPTSDAISICYSIFLQNRMENSKFLS